MKYESFKDLKEILKESDILESFEIMNAVTYYNSGEFDRMYLVIVSTDGGPKVFFQKLYVIFEQQKWRSAINKYLNFIGITIEFLKQDSYLKG